MRCSGMAAAACSSGAGGFGAAPRPNRSSSDGRTNRFSSVEVDEAAEDDDGQRVLDLVARALAEDDERHERQAGGQRGHQDRRQPFPGRAQHQAGPERLALLAFQVLGSG